LRYGDSSGNHREEESVVGRRYKTASEDSSSEDLVCPTVLGEMHRTLRAWSTLVVTDCRRSINPITSPNPATVHSVYVTILFDCCRYRRCVSHFQHVQTDSASHPIWCSLGHLCPFPGTKHLGSDADNSLQRSAKDKNASSCASDLHTSFCRRN
jgi:hypothetical protein